MIRESYINELFSRIAHKYDRLNTIISLGQHKKWRQFVLKKVFSKRGNSISNNNIVLDLCSGTGDFAIEAAKYVNAVVAIDFSNQMLQGAMDKIERLNLKSKIFLILSKIPPLPFRDSIFDCTTIGFGIRHIEIVLLLSEILRVLKPGGRIAILELAMPEGKLIAKLGDLYLSRFVPFFGELFASDRSAYDYLQISQKAYLPSNADLIKMIEQVGFVDVSFYPLIWGMIGVYIGKRR